MTCPGKLHVPIRFVPKLVFVLHMRSLLFKERGRKWRVGKKEKREKTKRKKGRKERTEEEESTRHRHGGPLSLFYARFPHFRLTPPPSHHLTRLTWSNIGYLNP